MLKKLFEIHEGKCTGCGAEVILTHEIKDREGWFIDSPKGIAISPNGHEIPLATVEHIHPFYKGGANTLQNTTLFCESCNRETALLHDPGYKKKTKC